MPARVVDASVIGAIAFEEPERAVALRLVAGHVLYAPTLLSYEVTSVARKKALAHPEKAEAISGWLVRALQSDFTELEIPHAAVLPVALDHGVSSYDAAYLWLARSLNAPLATLDRKLRAVASSLGL